jgi:poly(hydroxyalkanoate) granule-associated protein
MVGETLKDVPASLGGAARHVWFAGLGAVALAQEEGARLFDTLVSVGEQVEKEMKKTRLSPAAAVKGATAGVEDAWTKVQAMFDAQMAAALRRLGVPTKEEIAQLTRRIEALTASIEALRARG